LQRIPSDRGAFPVTDKGYHSGAVVKRMKAYEVRSYIPEKKPKGRRELGGQTGRTASGVRKPAAGWGRVRQEFTAATRRIGRAQLRALLPDGRDAALPSAWTGKHSKAATDPRGRVQSKPDPAPTTGRGHAPGVEEPLRQACFDPLLTLHVSDKSEAALQKPNLCVRCQVLREIAYPTTSPDLQEIRYLHPGLLGMVEQNVFDGHVNQLTSLVGLRPVFMVQRKQTA
jgi:hypothetical protein